MAITFQRTASVILGVVYTTLVVLFSLLNSSSKLSALSDYDGIVRLSPLIGTSHDYYDSGAFDGVSGSINDKCLENQPSLANDSWFEFVTDSDIFGSYTNHGTFVTQLQNARDGVGAYAVYTLEGDHNTREFVVVTTSNPASLVWESPTESPPAGQLKFRTTGGAGTRHVARFYSFCSPFGDTPAQVRPVIARSSTNPTDIVVSTENTFSRQYNNTTVDLQTKLNFVSGEVTHNYPAGYAGTMVPSTYNPSQNTPVHFRLDVDGYDIKGTYLGHELDDPECTIMNWIVQKVPNENIYGENLAVDDEFTYKIQEDGEYGVGLRWSWDHDKCGDNIAESQFMDTFIAFEVDGLSTNIFDTKYQPENCERVDHGGYSYTYTCDFLPEKLLDCSIYSPIGDMGEYIGCHLKNVISAIKIFFRWLFIPRAGYLKQRITSLSERIQEDNSLLIYGVGWFIGTAEQMNSHSATCDFHTGTIWGSSTYWDLCRMKSDWPGAWTLATTTARFSLAFTLVGLLYFAFMRKWSPEQ